MKVYELIKLTINDGDKEVETSLYPTIGALDFSFIKMVEEELNIIKENYGEESEDVYISLDEEAHIFYANDEVDPGMHETSIWMVEHEL